MRITSGMLSASLLTDLNNNLQALGKYQNQASSGRKLVNLSDDPVGIISSMNAREQLARIGQYQKRVQSAAEYLTQVETSVMELNEVVKKAYETAVQLSSDFMTEHDKAASAELIRELRDHVVALGNSTFGDVYLFGGFNTKTKPFEVDPGTGTLLYNGVDIKGEANPDLLLLSQQELVFEIGVGMRMTVSFNGGQLLGTGPDNVHAVLDGLYQALQGDESAEVLSSYADKLQHAQSHLLSLAAELGGKENRIELVKSRYEADHINYRQIQSDVEDVDEAEAVMYYKMAQTVYTYALQVGANILRTSLMDFLR